MYVYQAIEHRHSDGSTAKNERLMYIYQAIEHRHSDGSTAKSAFFTSYMLYNIKTGIAYIADM